MLENNLRQIAKYDPSFAESIKNHQVLGNVNFLQSKSGDYNLIYENIPFHSMDDPQKESIEILNKLDNTTNSVIHLIFGLGLGYLFKRVHLSSKGRIILYEPNMDILRITLEVVDFSTELADERVTIIQNKDDLKKAFEKYYLYQDPINVCFLDIYQKIFSKEIEEYATELSFLTRYYNNNYYTLYEASQTWLEKSLENYNNLLKSTYIDSLRNQFKNTPAIIVSAGPSLNKNADQLKAIEDRALIFSVSSSLRVLKEKFNVKPHFSAFIDDSDELDKVMVNVTGIDEINMIYQASTYPGMFKYKSKRNFIYLPKNDYFSNWIAGKLKLKNHHYANKGTVSITAIFTAINLGCNPIIIVGQDLAYTKDGKQYSDENIGEWYKDCEMLKVEGWDGEMLPTNSSFAVFLRYFQELSAEIAKEHNNTIKLINATEGGAYINGYEHIPLKEAIKLIPDKKIDVEKIINDSLKEYKNPLNFGKVHLDKEIKSIYNALPKLKKNIKLSLDLTSRINEELQKTTINKNYVTMRFKELFELNGKIDRIINDQCEFVNCLMQRENHEFIQGYSRIKDFENLDGIKEYIRLTKNYFNAIEKNIPRLNSLLENCIQGK